ncbi:MAG: TonB-dependent receptor, partial [Gammaproteobacteria bacterium]|nr:TonB-dependent receptor [Gammaproteobacteria bacterium]
MKAQSIVLALAGLAVTAPVVGQVVLEEVIVTAQRREQSLQDVPVSVTAFGGEQIERNNIRSARDFLSLTPNVSFTDDGQAGARSLGIAIRGINNLVSGENAFINSVGIYVDEFSIGSVPQGVPNLFTTDMQSIEVLRGPQGTYFGRNSLGGALNYRTNDPNFDEFAAKLIVGGESYEDAGDMYNVTGVFNIPVSDNFGLRGVVYWEDSSGLVENICAAGSTTGCPGAIENGFTTNGAEDSGHEWLDIRVKALWEPSDRTTVKGTFFYSDQDQGTDENVPSGVLDLDSVDTFGVTSASDPGTGFWPNNRNKNSHDLPESNQLETIVFVANIAHELTDDLTVKWISGVIDVEQTRLFDNDLVGGLDALSRDNLYEGTSWSTELRFELTKDRYDLVGGLLYAQDEQNQRNNVAVSSDATGTIGGVGILPPFPPGLGLARNTKSFEVESIALFGDLTWRFTDDLEGFIGLRLTHDEVDNSYLGFGLMPGPGGPPTFTNVQRGGATGSQEFDDISGRAGLRYQVNDDWSVYA